MFEDFIKILNESGKKYYFDNKNFYEKIIKCNYDIFILDKFAILIEERNLYGLKIGHSRGGIRYIGNPSINEFKEYLEKLKIFLNQKGYIFIGLEYLEEPNEFISQINESDYRYVMQGSAFIYPKENWLLKFNSEKRNKLLYAKKHGVIFEIIKKSDLNNDDLTSIYKLLSETAISHNNFKIPSFEEFRDLITNLPCIIAIGKLENEIICFDLIMIIDDKAERLYSATNEKGRNIRAVASMEVEVINYLSKNNFRLYDLWGIKKDKGFTDFKISIADEVINYDGKYRLIKVKNFIASFILWAWRIIKA
jgi:hypothetical protein